MSRPKVAYFFSRETGKSGPFNKRLYGAPPHQAEADPTCQLCLIYLSANSPILALSPLHTTPWHPSSSPYSLPSTARARPRSSHPRPVSFGHFIGHIACRAFVCPSTLLPMCSVHAGRRAAVEHGRRAAVTCESLGCPPLCTGLVMELLIASSLHKAALLGEGLGCKMSHFSFGAAAVASHAPVTAGLMRRWVREVLALSGTSVVGCCVRDERPR